LRVARCRQKGFRLEENEDVPVTVDATLIFLFFFFFATLFFTLLSFELAFLLAFLKFFVFHLIDDARMRCEKVDVP
jgi:hypothetical protein